MANGTIAFDTLQTSGQITGTAKSVDTDYVVNGSAKVWMQAVGAGTSYNDSFNTSSLTDVGTGNIRVTYTNNMSNDDSAFTLGHQYQSLSGSSAFATNAGAMTTSTHEHSHYQNGGLADPVKYSGAIHGDLA
jgi:hypothetical protein